MVTAGELLVGSVKSYVESSPGARKYGIKQYANRKVTIKPSVTCYETAKSHTFHI